MMKWRVMIACALCLPAAAMAQSKQVYFTDETRKADTEPAFYMDRNGDIYPPASVSLDMTYFINVKNGPRPKVSTGTRDYASLKSLYRWKDSTAADSDWLNLLRETGVLKTANFEADWAAVQAVLRTRVAQRVSQLGDAFDDVVLLIHGYNSRHEGSLGWYRAFEDSLRKDGQLLSRRVAFVRMYWDGLAGATPFFVWKGAQFNGYNVGLELRRLLREVDAETPLRVFTHSSGAYVITNALGDASAAADTGKLGADYRLRSTGRAAGYEPPMHLRDLRVVMLVPAQPTTAFQYYFSEPSDTTHVPDKPALVPSRLVLGLSKRDVATFKAGACRWFGATCMAVRVQSACRDVASHLKVAPPRLLAVNFAKQGLFHKHAVGAYMRDAEWAELSRALIAPDPALSESSERLCKTSGRP